MSSLPNIGEFYLKYVELACQGRANEILFDRVYKWHIIYRVLTTPVCEAISKEEFRRGEPVSIWTPRYGAVWVFKLNETEAGKYVAIWKRAARSEEEAKARAEGAFYISQKPLDLDESECPRFSCESFVLRRYYEIYKRHP